MVGLTKVAFHFCVDCRSGRPEKSLSMSGSAAKSAPGEDEVEVDSEARSRRALALTIAGKPPGRTEEPLESIQRLMKG